MKPTEINRAIAELCGWKDPHWECPQCGRVEPSHVTFEERHDRTGCLQFVHWITIPNYHASLDACAEFERTIENQFTTLHEAYWRNLSHVQPHPIYATAPQRCEAFLRLHGKWEESK